jgi:hypothetical protein
LWQNLLSKKLKLTKIETNKISKNDIVTINASITIYIEHNFLNLITEFAEVNAKELNIDMKLKGFKKHII